MSGKSSGCSIASLIASLVRRHCCYLEPAGSSGGRSSTTSGKTRILPQVAPSGIQCFDLALTDHGSDKALRLDGVRDLLYMRLGSSSSEASGETLQMMRGSPSGLIVSWRVSIYWRASAIAGRYVFHNQRIRASLSLTKVVCKGTREPGRRRHKTILPVLAACVPLYAYARLIRRELVSAL